MRSRSVGAWAALVCLAALLSGCVGEPAPVETTPGFASEAEAFAAAEQTYRNYVDALNQVDLSDPATFEPMLAWTTGDASSAVRKSYSQMHADGWVITGHSSISLVQPVRADGAGRADVELAVCLDVSGIDVLDADRTSVVSADRLDRQPMTINLLYADASPTRMLIDTIHGREGEPNCASG